MYPHDISHSLVFHVLSLVSGLVAFVFWSFPCSSSHTDASTDTFALT